jgi:hypothetical protein
MENFLLEPMSIRASSPLAAEGMWLEPRFQNCFQMMLNMSIEYSHYYLVFGPLKTILHWVRKLYSLDTYQNSVGMNGRIVANRFILQFWNRHYIELYEVKIVLESSNKRWTISEVLDEDEDDGALWSAMFLDSEITYLISIKIRQREGSQSHVDSYSFCIEIQSIRFIELLISSFQHLIINTFRQTNS